MMRHAMKDLKPRLIMTTICVLFLFFFIGFAEHTYFKPVFVGAVAFVASVAFWEYCQIVKMKGIVPCTKVGIVGTVCYAYAIYFGIESSFFSFLPLFVLGIILTLSFLMRFNEVENALASVATTFFGIVYITVTFSGIIVIMYHFPQVSGKDGRLWLIYLLAVSKMTDVGGLFIGRFCGKKSLIPKISPNKTVAGAFGGILFAGITSVGFAYATGFKESSALGLTLLQSIYLGLILGFFAEIGDLAESLLKRDGKIKDSNPHFPGLGGALDTVDSLLFTTPIVCLFLQVAI
ncbi:MAG: phosphatidate cytidylyltransferase [Chlamydiales bacterium]|nr:phosphatidate cytidylyltransferase [Chlamydiales bacterium]